MGLKTNVAQILASAAVAVALAVSAGGCSNIASRDTTGSIAAAPATQDEARRSLEALGARYRDNPNDADAAIAYARALRMTEQRAQAVAVLEQASIRNPRYMPLLGAYGRALAEAGQYPQALTTLERAFWASTVAWAMKASIIGKSSALAADANLASMVSAVWRADRRKRDRARASCCCSGWGCPS